MSHISLPATFPVACHTNQVGPGSIFVAIQGAQQDGAFYIQKALERGATGIIIQENVIVPETIAQHIKAMGVKLIRVDNTRKALAELSAQAAGFPAKKLKIIAVTGTKGKSTTSFLLEHIFKTAGYKTALISTIKNRILDAEFEAPLTTPHPDYLHVFLKTCLQASVDYVIMEVAAQAVSLYRVFGLEFDSLIFTNFSQEHGEFYSCQDDYFDAKAALCKQLFPNGHLFLNVDDKRVWSLAGCYPHAISFGLDAQAVFSASCAQQQLSGIQADLFYERKKICSVNNQQLYGMFNIYNIIAASGLASMKAISPMIIAQALNTFSGAPGRLQRFLLPNGAVAFIDYAHNPASFEAVLSYLKTLGKQLIVVFGAGGDRDNAKRPVMGAVASKYGDEVIITSDNPRSEEPQLIIHQIVAGIAPENTQKITIEIDRKKAIERAYQLSGNKTVIALLGKGPDEYQLVKGVKTYFSEAQILSSL